MTINYITSYLETIAPLSLQEDYDNAGLITGSKDWECSGALISLDVTEEIISEAIENKCNLVIAHHPAIFRGLKKINGKNYTERVIISAIKNDIAIYAIHTNLDNVLRGVNGKIAEKLGLKNTRVLLPKESVLKKLVTFVPPSSAEKVREAIFAAGGGHIGNYSECSFVSEGRGSFKPESGARPVTGSIGKREEGPEIKLELIFPNHSEQAIISAMKGAHEYEEVAYDIIPLDNHLRDCGNGLAGELETAVTEEAFLRMLSVEFGVPAVRHTVFTGRKVKKVALCGGAGSFLVQAAKSAGADVYVTSDLKYHEFFDADRQLLLADIGHYESEQFTTELIHDLLTRKFPNFALLKTGRNTNPVRYFIP